MAFICKDTSWQPFQSATSHELRAASNPRPARSRLATRGSRLCDRVGGEVALAVLPHHRTCGSASGGSGSRREASLGFQQRDRPQVVEPRLRVGGMQMRGSAVPPRTASVGGRLRRAWPIQPSTHQVLRPRVSALPMPPLQRPQLVPDPAIEFFQHTFHFGEPEVCHPASQYGVELPDDLFQTASACAA